MLKIPFRADSPVIAFLLITVVAGLIYSNTFFSPFHFDDGINIVENASLRDLSNFWPASGTRYVGYLSFALNYHFGKLDVFGYHLVNLVIHTINGFLVWWLVFLTFKSPLMAGRAGAGGLARHQGYIALMAALLFVAHPIQTQAVTYIVQRFTSLSTFFYLLSLVMYIQARLLGQNRASTQPITLSPSTSLRTGLSKGCYVVALVSAVLAMKTKEISFTLPLIIVLYEFALLGDPERRKPRVWEIRRFALLVPFLVTLLIVPFSLLRTDKPLGAAIGGMGAAAMETEAISRGDYLLTQFRVIVTYLRLLALPVNQNLDHDYPISRSFDLSVFVSFAFLVMIVGAAVYLFYLSRRVERFGLRLIGFGIFWFFITLSVESSIIPIRDVIYEHRLYLPSVGAFLAFVSGAFYLYESIRPSRSPFQVTCILLLVTVVPLGIVAYNRNIVWKKETSLWEDVVRKSPYKGRGYAELGYVYAKEGRLEEAYLKFTDALKLAPNYVEAHLNLGTFYLTQGRLEEAAREYRIALKLAPDHPKAHYNLGVVYHQQRRLEEAADEYGAALRVMPEYIQAHVNLGALYAMQGRLEEAARELTFALELAPDDPLVHLNLGKVYRAKGMQAEAKKHFETALKLRPNFMAARQALQSPLEGVPE